MNEKLILNGLPKIIANADAILLYESNRNERAYSLFQLSIEEIAKASILLGVLLFEDISSKEVQKRIKYDITHHQPKSIKSIGIDSIYHQFLKEVDEEKYEQSVLDSIKEYDSIKQLDLKKNNGFYTSFNGNKFQSPSELIKKEDAKDIMLKAESRIAFGKKIFLTIIENYDSLKNHINSNVYDESEQVVEFNRIINKFGLR